ncbi:MAG TPA: ABC transporter ATP-binding protein [Candidatus Dormibacteraeota bacterium]|jgi:ABC-2 type transport system ATP-binding protein|nr:ABC transporter ATP-binding protein [Candidatus Dormibacteraeota bacterium]
MALPAVVARGLTKDFGAFRALDGVSFSVAAGEALVILGENGAGKTTTLRCLAGVLTPSAGEVLVGGISVADDPDAVRTQVGLLSEVPGVYERMTAPGYLDFFGRVQGMPGPDRAARIPAMLEMFGLAGRAEAWMGSYSKGMRQKVALIRATLHRPRVLLLDEPTSSMDPAGARLTWDFILRLKQSGLAVVVCTHNLRETARVADRLAIMARGRILAQGSLDELQRDLGLEPRYVQTLVPGLEDIYMEVMQRAGLAPGALLGREPADAEATTPS